MLGRDLLIQVGENDLFVAGDRWCVFLRVGLCVGVCVRMDGWGWKGGEMEAEKLYSSQGN